MGGRVQADRPAADRRGRRLAAGPDVGDDERRAVRRSRRSTSRPASSKLTRVLAIQDCGLVVSRLTAESQVYGGVIGSLNFAMFEDRILDRNTGQMVNPNMEWYLLAGMSDIPQIDVRLKDQPERGVIGLGEPPTVPTAAAIALAVRNAIGVTVRSLPLTPAKILQALQQREQRARLRGGVHESLLPTSTRRTRRTPSPRSRRSSRRRCRSAAARTCWRG